MYRCSLYITGVILIIYIGHQSFKTNDVRCKSESLTTSSGSYSLRGKICSGDLIFEENFDEFNLKKWQHELTLGGGGNWEFQWYNNNRTNSYTEDGILHIKPTLLADEFGNEYLYSGTLDINGGSPADECTNPQWYGCSRTGNGNHILNPVKSARIRTINSFSYKYGKLEIRAKNPTGDWLWPAIGLLPRWNQYSSWPSSGEIGILQGRGNINLLTSTGENIGTQQIRSMLHWGPNSNFNRNIYTTFQLKNSLGFNANFHRYQMEWTTEKIMFSIDDQVIGAVSPPSGGFWELGKLNASGVDNPWKRNGKMAPFDQEFYIVIYLAVGGTNGYFPDDAINSSRKPWLNTSPRAASDFWEGREKWYPTWKMDTNDSHFQIDYVKVWAL